MTNRAHDHPRRLGQAQQGAFKIVLNSIDTRAGAISLTAFRQQQNNAVTHLDKRSKSIEESATLLMKMSKKGLLSRRF